MVSQEQKLIQNLLTDLIPEKKALEISAVLEGVVLAKWLHFFYRLALAVHCTYISTTTKQMGASKLSLGFVLRWSTHEIYLYPNIPVYSMYFYKPTFLMADLGQFFFSKFKNLNE